MRIRWTTWWPVPYWTDRFNALAVQDGVELEICFLAEKSELLPLSNDPASWRFKHRYLSSGADRAGYYRRVFRVRNPWPLIRGRFDALVMTYADPICIAAAICAKALGKPVFFFTGNTADDFRKANWLTERMKRAVLRLATGMFVTGPAQRRYAEKYVGNSFPIYEIGNPVKRIATDEYLLARRELRTQLGLSDADIALLFVGRLAAEKGLDDLFDALALCCARGLCPRLFLVGNGPERTRLGNEASKRGLPIEFHGLREGDELANRYAAADVFVLPSLSEPWGLVVNEAMQFGLPLILSRRVGCRSVLLRPGQNGLDFEAGDVAALGDAIYNLAANRQLRIAMGQVSRRLIDSHTIENWVLAVVEAVKASQRPQAQGRYTR